MEFLIPITSVDVQTIAIGIESFKKLQLSDICMKCDESTNGNLNEN